LSLNDQIYYNLLLNKPAQWKYILTSRNIWCTIGFNVLLQSILNLYKNTFFCFQNLYSLSNFKITIWIVVLFVGNIPVGHAQITPLKQGDTVPDINFNNVLNYKNSNLQLSDYEGKLVILDCWATWCGSCIAQFSKVNALQQEFSDKLQFIMVNSIKGTGENAASVQKFLDKWQHNNQLNLIMPFAVEDVIVKELFPRLFLPHYVWISPSGTFMKTTGADAITSENISLALEHDVYTMPVKEK
jgi:thiol-disulfide isomerase/thioredoxin